MKQLRANWWDYGFAGSYFITIVTKDRVKFFGEVRDRQMHLSEIGRIVREEWQKTFDIRQEMKLTMGPFVVMPDHFHAILAIGKNKYNNGQDAFWQVDTRAVKKRFGPQKGNLSSLVRGFKIGVTTNARLVDPYFAWQTRFHDHLIRDKKEFERISQYIIDNPRNWSEQ